MHMNNLWWNTVPNSVRFIDDIVAAFYNGSSVVCVIHENCEWVETFRMIIKDKILSGVNKTYEISGKDMDASSPGEYLTERFVSNELRVQFRTSVGYEAFLTKIEAKTSLIDSYIYIRDLNEKQTREWLDFIYKYNELHTVGSLRCKFIIESEINVVEDHKGIKVFRKHEYLHMYDIMILCMMATSSMSLSSAFRDYSTELATYCAHNDPEFAAELIMTGEEFLQNTQGVVERIVRDSLRSNYKTFDNVQDINNIIWKAQLKVFFPLIERYRYELIKKYEFDIPIDKCINMIGENIESVYDIELNTIKWLCDNDDLHLCKEDYDKMKFFKQCRNELAHLKPLPFESLKTIAETAFTAS